MEEGRIINGEELGGAAALVVPVADGGGSDEEAEAEDGAIHGEGFPAESHGVEVQNLSSDPRAYDALRPPELGPVLGLRPDPEEGPHDLETEAEALRPGGGDDVGHGGERHRPLGGRRARSFGR